MSRDGRGPDLATLADWLQGRVGREESERLAEAVRTDPSLHAEVGWVRALLDVGAEVPLVEPPARLGAELGAEFRRRNAGAAGSGAGVRAAVAALVYDSRREPLAAGLRAAADTDDAVHLCWQAEDAEVIVQVRRAGGELLRVDGQVLGGRAAGVAGCVVLATAPSGGRVMTEADPLGRFRLEVHESLEELSVVLGTTTLVARLDPGGGWPDGG